MTRLMMSFAATAVLAGGFAALPAPAAAQAGQTTLVVYGNDPCPREYICIRKGESERYRLPKDAEWSRIAGLDNEAGDSPESRHLADREEYPWGKETFPRA